MNIIDWIENKRARRRAVQIICTALKLPRRTSDRTAMHLAQFAIFSSECRGIEVPRLLREATETLERGGAPRDT